MDLPYFLATCTEYQMKRPRGIKAEEIQAGAKPGEDPAALEAYINLDKELQELAPGTASVFDETINGGVRIRTFSKTWDHSSNLNEASIVSVIGYDGFKIVIPGDNGSASLGYLMTQDDFRSEVAKADILVAPHHGRESGYHLEFVKLCAPKLVVISDDHAGKTNATDKYSKAAKGMDVTANGVTNHSFVVSTMNNGCIWARVKASGGSGTQESSKYFARTGEPCANR